MILKIQLVRELRVLGQQVTVGDNDENSAFQHKGYGEYLMRLAEIKHINMVTKE